MRLKTKALLFLLLNLLIAATLETIACWKYESLFEMDEELKKSVRHFESRAKRIQAVLLGDCRIFYSFNPQDIALDATTHNFSFPGERIASSYFKLKYYLERGELPQLTLALLHIDSERLQEDGPFNSDVDYSRFIPFAALFEQGDRWETFHASLSRVSHLYRLLPHLLHLPLKSDQNNMNELGYAKLAAILDKDTFEVSRNKFSWNESIFRPDTLDYYVRFQQLIQKHRVRLAFFRLPRLKSRARSVNPLTADAVSYELRDTLRREFPGVPLIDLDANQEDFDLEDFADIAGHLTPRGSMKAGYLIFRKLITHKLVTQNGKLIPLRNPSE